MAACECPVCCCTSAVTDRLELTKKDVLDYLELSLECIGQTTTAASIGDNVLQFDEVICFEHNQCLIIAGQEYSVTAIDYANNTVTIEPELHIALSECTPVFSSGEFGLIEKMILAAKELTDRCLNNPFVDGCCNPLPIPHALCMPILQLVSRWYERRSIGLSSESKTGLGSVTWGSDQEFEDALCKWMMHPVLELDCASGTSYGKSTESWW